jgi:cytochrome P450
MKAMLQGPKGLPLLGNLLQMDAEKPHVTLRKWSETYGPIFRFSLGTKRFVAITDHLAIQELLRDRPERVRRMRSMQEVIDEIVGIGLFSAEGEAWRRQRHLTTTAFNWTSLQQDFAQVQTVTHRLLRVLEIRAATREPFEILQDFMKYAVDVTTWLSTGRDVNTLETVGEDFQRDLEHGFPAISRRINSPFPYWRYVKFGRDRVLDRALNRLRARVQEMVAMRREEQAQAGNGNGTGAGLLDALINARDEQGLPLKEEEIFGNILTILTAGEDTTAYSLAWTIVFMTTSQDVQRRMREEAEQVLGKTETAESFADVQRLAFIEAVTLEAMRLKPVAPFLFLEANEDLDVLGTRIPKGMNLVAMTSFDALAEENFTFAKEFRPERWLDAERPSDWKHNVRAFMPFGGGTRVCPGRTLAMVEMKSVLAMICCHFQVVRPEEAGAVAERFTFSVAPDHLQVILRPHPRVKSA